MKVYEFYFNPGPKKKIETDLIFDSFCYEPLNIYEKKMGSLYLVGLLKNVLPKNLHLLETLAQFIREGYYKKAVLSPEKSLRKVLKETNVFLDQMIGKGDVSWLGNLSLAVLALKDFKLNFAKVGGIKIVLLRGGKIVDIDRKLKFQDIEPYPLKIFGTVVSGKLNLNDLVLIFTENIFDFFQKENLLNEIAKSPQLLEEKLKNLLEEKKEELIKIRGILLVISLIKEIVPGKKEIIAPKISKEFSLKEVFLPYFKFFKEKLSFQFSKILALLPQPQLIFNKKWGLILILIFVLFFGFLIDRNEKRKKMNLYLDDVEEIEEKLKLAEELLAQKEPQNEEKANLLLKESFEKISPILKDSSELPRHFSTKVLSLNEKILSHLYLFNKLEMIENPEIYFRFEAKKFIPQKLIFAEDTLYFFSPYSKNIFKLDKNKKEVLMEIDKKFDSAVVLKNNILFFTKPNQLTILRNDQFSILSLEIPHQDFDFSDLAYFKENLYFFDKKAGQIIKYPLTQLEQDFFKLGKPEVWLKKVIENESKSFGVDGFLWILNKDAILKYQTDDLKERIKPDIFPPPKEFSKIFVSPTLPHLYILEPLQKRILIFDKSGQILKQFQSEKFNNLLDFAISQDGKTIFLLNDLKVYRIGI